MSYIITISLALFSYLLGSIPFGLLLGRTKGIDIRTEGSHNIGATNTLRVCGPILGALAFILDFLKGAIPVILIKYIIDMDKVANDVPNVFTSPLFFGLLSIIGHLFPVFLKFKGGKGISCFTGVMFLYNWQLALITFAIFVIVFLTTRIVSISSISSAFFLLFGYWILHLDDTYLLVTIIIMFILIVYKHRSNIKRLIEGNENQFSFKKHK